MKRKVPAVGPRFRISLDFYQYSKFLSIDKYRHSFVSYTKPISRNLLYNSLSYCKMSATFKRKKPSKFTVHHVLTMSTVSLLCYCSFLNSFLNVIEGCHIKMTYLSFQVKRSGIEHFCSNGYSPLYNLPNLSVISCSSNYANKDNSKCFGLLYHGLVVIAVFILTIFIRTIFHD